MYVAGVADEGREECELQDASCLRDVDYASGLIIRFAKGEDGQIARERKSGRVDYMGLVEFGECIYFLPQFCSDTRRDNVEPRFQNGVFLGVENDLERTSLWQCRWLPQGQRW